MLWISVLLMVLLAPVFKLADRLFLICTAVAALLGIAFRPKWTIAVMVVGCAADIALLGKHLARADLSVFQFGTLGVLAAFAWLVWAYALVWVVRFLRRRLAR